MNGMLADVITGFSILMLGYLVVINAIQTALVGIGWRAVEQFVDRRPFRDYKTVANSALSLPVSILVPAYNEGPVIAPAVRSLLESQFSEFEVIVINDGSTDETLEVLEREFRLFESQRVPGPGRETQPVLRVFRSAAEPRLVVLDKQNGGKADSLNAGIRYSRYPLFCAIDADTVLDPGALARLVWEFQASEDTVAVGGIVRIANGCRVRDGRLVDVRMPRSLLEGFQVLEYLRAFLGGRIAWSRLGLLLIVSGAFGLFRKQAVIDAGSYDPEMVGEDAELILRLHIHRREQGRQARITFFPDPICWTEAPATWRVLARQRDRWQRGLAEMLWKHRKAMLNPRYGRVGLVAMPYYALFELLGPTLEAVGLLAIAIGLVSGLVSVPFAATVGALTIFYGLALSLGSILLEERAFRRYPTWRCLGRLVALAVLENFGYRQALSLVRMRSWWTLARDAGWGEMKRAGFDEPAATHAEPRPWFRAAAEMSELSRPVAQPSHESTA